MKRTRKLLAAALPILLSPMLAFASPALGCFNVMSARL